MTTRVRVFGSAQVEGQAPLGRRDRVVLAALVVSWSSPLSAAGLAEALYGEEPPQTWRKVVQGSVARLRQLLGPRTIETTPDGYRLTIGDDDVDVRPFERLLRQAVELSELGQPAGAIAPLRHALWLFRGEPLADLDGWMPGREEAGRLAELGRLGEERLVAVLLADGRVDELGDPIALGIRGAGAAIRPDGLEAAVATDHGIVVWDLDPEHWVPSACAIAGRNLTRAEWDQYVGDLAPYRSTCPEFSAEA